MTPVLPNPAARRLFLHLHGLADAPVGPAAGAALGALIDRIQVDSINTVARAHDMILWSRRGAYRPAALRRALEGERRLWEHWTHDASVLPVGLWPMWRARFARDEARLHRGWRRVFREGWEAEFGTILDRIARDGPVSSSDVGEGEARGRGGWWDWHPSKTALEWLWRTGRIAVTRRDGFRKVYDLTERVIPEVAAYWSAVSAEAARGWLAQAVRSGRVEEVAVEGADGTRRRVFALPGLAGAEVPEPPARLRVLSPFDPALRDRKRAERLFGFHYRIEVFVPERLRTYGYYVFPLLEGATLIGRIDAKAHRDQNCLRVRALWPERGIRFGRQRQARLEAELARLGRLAGVDRVEFAPDWLRDPV